MQEVTTNATETQKIMRLLRTVIHQQLNKPEEMDKFLETYSLPRLSHVKTKNLNIPITSKEIESVIKNLPTNKSL